MNKGIIIAIAVVVIAGALYLLSSKKDAQEASAPTNTASQNAANDSTNENEAVAVDTNEVEAGNYAVATEESTVQWQGSKTLIANYKDNGILKIESGNLIAAEDGNVTGTIIFDMTTIAATSTGRGTGEDMLSNHLKSDDFFSVETYPTAEFTIKKAEPATEGSASHTITGDLTIKGITHEISFPATVGMKDGQLVANATVTLDRTLWDVRFGSDKFFDNLANNVIDDNFIVTFALIANKQ